MGILEFLIKYLKEQSSNTTMKKLPHDQNEIIAIVDNKNRVIGGVTRKEAHEEGLLHREVYVYIVNTNKEVLLQKRVDNHLWDHSVGAHFPKNETYLDAAQREVKEELGIRLKREDFREIAVETYKKIEPGVINYRLAKIFLVKKDILLKDFIIDKREVEEIRYFNKDKLDKLLKIPRKIMTGSAKDVLKKHILEEL